MSFVDIIEKKANKQSLTNDEIVLWISGVVSGTIPDYQTSALLMAIVLNGMDERETVCLTKAMMNSGDVMDLRGIEGIKADKHSTGGVGDKTSLVLGAMVAACGLKVAKMSGRGLGHTGGTLDKLESIKGFRCFLTQEEFIRQVQEIGIAIVGQTGNLVPADKTLYALRDVTGTVRSMPLIASSIMSKKLASGADTILLDVKYGEGAFMRNKEEAQALAKEMIVIGKELGRDTIAMITDMNQPLGNAIGNALEVMEAIETLKGKGPLDFTELCLQAGELMLLQGKLCTTTEEARKRLTHSIACGGAFEKFKEMVMAQGGDVSVIEDTQKLPSARHITEMKSLQEGYLGILHCQQLGILAMELGAGRQTKEDVIDYGVGIVIHKKRGDYIKKGETLCCVHHNAPLTKQWTDGLYNAFVVGTQPVAQNRLIEMILS